MIRAWGLLLNRNLYYTIPFIGAKLFNGYVILEVVHILHNMLLILLGVLIATNEKKKHLPCSMYLTWTAYRWLAIERPLQCI